MEDITSQFTPEEMEEKKVMAILSYLGFLVIIPILQAKDSAYVRFHINQGVVLVGIAFATNIMAFIPVVGGIIATIGSVGFVVVAIMNILNVVNKKTVKFPILSNFEIIK